MKETGRVKGEQEHSKRAPRKDSKEAPSRSRTQRDMDAERSTKSSGHSGQKSGQRNR